MIPEYIKRGEISLASAEYREIADKVGGFHDAWIKEAAFQGGCLTITIANIYFYDEAKYDQFGVCGGEIKIFPSEIDRTWSCVPSLLVERDIYRIERLLAQHAIRFILSELEMSFRVHLSRSLFRWIFRS